MSRWKQSGFTLVELVIVMGITTLLAALVLEGQLQLRSRIQFDADVDNLVANIAEARNAATAAMNQYGNGTGQGDQCSGYGGSVPTVFAGTAFVADNSLPAGPFEIDYYKANPGGAACIFETEPISVPSGLEVSGTGGQELFVRTDNGGLDVCPVALPETQAIPDFEAGACNSGSWTLNLTDPDGHTSAIQVDASGLAKRLN